MVKIEYLINKYFTINKGIYLLILFILGFGLTFACMFFNGFGNSLLASEYGFLIGMFLIVIDYSYWGLD